MNEPFIKQVTVDRYFYGETRQAVLDEVNKHPGLRLIDVYSTEKCWVAECREWKK